MIFINAFSWYLVIALAGWLIFPLAYRIFAFLPDRGLSLARPLGLLFWGYAFWLLASLHVLQNDTGGVLFALILIGGLSAWLLGRDKWKEITAWLRENISHVVGIEILFLVVFFAWVIIRAAMPDVSGTEKPMELAFINSLLRSPAFPPADPWLSGYSISYYYFGYVMVAMLARITAVPGAVAFNLAVAAWFALTALGAFGILSNLLSMRNQGSRPGNFLAGLTAPFMVLVAGNLEGFLEMLHARGIFWKQGDGGAWTSGFWKWLDIQELTSPPSLPLNWQPERLTGIWWWRASRVLQDYAVDRSSREVIDEFPMFSFLLGDLHPHVLAMPFALLAIGLALNVYLQIRAAPPAFFRIMDWIKRPDFWAISLTLGGLAFLNTWDFPIYLALFAGSASLSYISVNGWRFEAGILFIWLMVGLGLVGGLLFFPFYLSFASQANGFLPSLVFFTRGVHLWVMFAIQLIPIILWMIWSYRKSDPPGKLKPGFLLAAGLIGGLWLLSLLYGFMRLRTDPGLAGIWGTADASLLLAESVWRRLSSPGAWLTLLGLLALGWALLSVWTKREKGVTGIPNGREEIGLPAGEPGKPFVILVFLLGAGLVIFPEFFYLRDQFGFRMNTIFKFYFQAWILWSIVASFAAVVLFRGLRGTLGWMFRAGFVGLVLISLPYAYFGVLSRTNQFRPAEWTLDGSGYLARYAPDEMEAIRWLQNAPYGVVAEAVGGSYTGYARVSTHSGLPTVLGWPGHESQWRGGAKEMGSREADIKRLFKSRDWEQARQVLEQYQIRYVYIGPTEVRDHNPDMSMFQRNMPVVFQNTQVIIFEYPSADSLQEQANRP